MSVDMFFVVVVCVLSNLQTSLQQRAINIVKGRMATYCSGTTDKLTDEKLDTKITIVCTSAIFIQVDFDGNYSVQYATIQCDNVDNEYHAFDFFDVVLHSRQEQKLCGSYHAFIATHIPEANLYRVNCKRYRDKFDKVTFKGESSEIFTADVSEVAVYVFSSSKNPAQPFIYIGCFKSVNIMELFDYESIHQCSQDCIMRNYVVMAIMKPIAWCVCSNRVYRKNITSIHECNISCEERYYSCGAARSYSVYLLDFKLPAIELCTGVNTSLKKIIRERDEPKFDRSIRKCIYNCEEYNFIFMEHGWCTCTNKSIDSDQRENCNITCSEREPGEYCGSGYVLFSTCLSPDFTYMGCRELLRCSTFDMYGVCQSPCFSTGFDGQDNEPAYIGPHCIGYDSMEFQSKTNETMEQGTIDATNTQGPFTQGTFTQGPLTQGPFTQGPLTQAPFTQGPLTQGPFTQGPLTQVPLTQGPLTQGPFTQGPFTQGPLTQGPFTQGPFTQGPFTQGPLTQEPLTQETKQSRSGTGSILGSESIVRVVVAFVSCFVVEII